MLLLGALLVVAELYLVASSQLLDLGGGDVVFFVTTIPALAFAVALVAACVPFRDDPSVLVGLIVVGAVAAAALSAPAPEAAAPFKALFAAGVGLTLARFIPVASIVYLLAIAVAIADFISVSVGPTNYLVNEQPGLVGYLALAIPSWSGGISQLGVSDLIFTALYLSTAWRFGLRRRATVVALAASLIAALAIATWADWIVPALPLLSLGLLAPNADLVWRTLRDDLKKLN